MLDTLLPILIFTALALAVIGALRRIRLWRQGRPSRVNLFKGLMALPRRYLVDLHHVVGRDKMISNTHVATAGGFVAAAVLMILVHGLGIANPLLGGLLLLASACMFVGSLFVARRRLNPPARLSKGPWMRLPKSLMAFSISVFLITLPTVGLLPEGLLEGGGSWLLALVLAGVV
ncbi:MAG: DUF3483 domain-containing protein, partial [Halomonas sp.]|nr:DUF3483 domain-containing protein [Halomonas sp.]